jgi:hypothetical protein
MMDARSHDMWGWPVLIIQIWGYSIKLVNDFYMECDQQKKSSRKKTENLRTDISTPTAFSTLEFERHGS